MNKSIQETHPAFARIWTQSVGMPLDGQTLKEAIQKTTVDRSEHERCMADWVEEQEMQSKLIFDINKMVFEKQEELEKLQQTLYKEREEHERIVAQRRKDAFGAGQLLGERVALRRVKEQIKEFKTNLRDALGDGDYEVLGIEDFLEDVGLDDANNDSNDYGVVVSDGEQNTNKKVKEE